MIRVGMKVLKNRFVFLIPLIFLFFSCATSGKKEVLTGKAPAWIQSVDSVYSKAKYAAASGFGTSRAAAESNAIASLVSFFGQSIQVERTAASFYQQAIVNGSMASWIDTAEMKSNIKTVSSMDNLMGAEITEVWFDSKDTYYAVAVMEKERGVRIYNELLKANLNVINNLVTMTPNEKNSLEGVIRYKFASVIADVNVSYRNIVVLLDGLPPDGIVSGNQYRLESQNIIKTIPITIRVNDDRNGRIYGAFARCFTNWGFDAAVNNSRYILNVNVNLSPVNYPSNPNVFSRIELEANLRDTVSGLVLLPFNFNGREGHINQAEADNRAVAAAERRINDEFAVILSDYLSRIYPR